MHWFFIDPVDGEIGEVIASGLEYSRYTMDNGHTEKEMVKNELKLVKLGRYTNGFDAIPLVHRLE